MSAFATRRRPDPAGSSRTTGLWQDRPGVRRGTRHEGDPMNSLNLVGRWVPVSAAVVLVAACSAPALAETAAPLRAASPHDHVGDAYHDVHHQPVRPLPEAEVTKTVTEVVAIPFATRTVDDELLDTGQDGAADGRPSGQQDRHLDWFGPAEAPRSAGPSRGRRSPRHRSTRSRRSEPRCAGSQGHSDAPEAAPSPTASTAGGCDSNYAGACVPIASDVDCAGRQGQRSRVRSRPGPGGGKGRLRTGRRPRRGRLRVAPPGALNRTEAPALLPEVANAPSVQKMQRGPSIYDVAKAAGVAPSTVSRAFSRPGRVNSRTAERVFAAAREVGYRSEALHGLTGQRTRSLAVVVTDITQPVLLRDHPRRPRGGGGVGLHDPAVPHPGGRPARTRLDRARAGRRRGGPADQLADVRQRDPDAGQAEADGHAQPSGPRGPVRDHRQRPRYASGRRAPRGARPRVGHLRRRSRGQLGRRDALGRA